MWYVYVLISDKNKRLYTGLTSDLRRRVIEHNRKQGGSYTSKNGPFKLIFYEAYIEKSDAAAAEKFFKSGYGREVIKQKLKVYLEKTNGL
ncbi:MAG: GIY-YIG nuclease family protein [Candidatus Doudnabacteria bacterium]|nr:GIY-YIG nuclease family protein [Candidatus Doudnabacteria bacterium]